MNATPALRQADVPTLAHWIGGKRTPGTSGRFGDVYTPATGALGSRVPFATTAEVGRAVDAAQAAFAGLGRHDAALACPRHVPVQGAARAARRRDRRRDLARARQGALGRRRRARARHRDRRVRVRRAAAPEERVHRERRHRASTPTRCASRSAWSPASRRSTFRRWCRSGCFRWRSSAATRSS